MIERTYRARLLRIRQTVSKIQLAHVHEIGSALGFGLPIAEELFRARISSSDISSEAVEACRTMGYESHLSDRYGRTMTNIEVDLVYSFDVIEHVPNIRYFIDWLSSIVRPGGYFCLTTPNMNHPINKILRSRSPSVKIPQHVIYFTEYTLTRALSEHFTFVRSFWDYQVVSLGSLLTRMSHILGLPPTSLHSGPAIPIYNGMELYIYKRM